MATLFYLSEQNNQKELTDLTTDLRILLSSAIKQKPFFYKADLMCFHLHEEAEVFKIDTNYFVGVDWLVPSKAAIYVEPKLNDTTQINFLGMLLQSLEVTENTDHLDGLFHVDYEQEWISIPEQKDLLSPILIVQFLKLLQRIVRKGLKKSYYRVTENLNSRIKGKVLIGQQIKQNIVKNRQTQTICSYQEYGVNTIENQFLKLVLEFVSTYINQKERFFSNQQRVQLQHILNYCLPSFEQVDVLKEEHTTLPIQENPFYKEYSSAIKTGKYILKRFSFNIHRASESQTKTPPFWIDMSKLFELYVFRKLKKHFPGANAVSYHDTYWGGKETDILVRAGEYKCVIDCKYKPQYKNSTPSLEDKRQLAGYTRMISVYNKLGVPYNEVIKGLIIYSDQRNDESEEIDMGKFLKIEIGEYVEFYKLGIKLPGL